jgi:hypothetical protein
MNTFTQNEPQPLAESSVFPPVVSLYTDLKKLWHQTLCRRSSGELGIPRNFQRLQSGPFHVKRVGADSTCSVSETWCGDCGASVDNCVMNSWCFCHFRFIPQRSMVSLCWWQLQSSIYNGCNLSILWKWTTFVQMCRFIPIIDTQNCWKSQKVTTRILSLKWTSDAHCMRVRQARLGVIRVITNKYFRRWNRSTGQAIPGHSWNTCLCYTVHTSRHWTLYQVI